MKYILYLLTLSLRPYFRYFVTVPIHSGVSIVSLVALHSMFQQLPASANNPKSTIL